MRHHNHHFLLIAALGMGTVALTACTRTTVSNQRRVAAISATQARTDDGPRHLDNAPDPGTAVWPGALMQQWQNRTIPGR